MLLLKRLPNKNSIKTTNLTSISFSRSEFSEFPDFQQIANRSMFKSEYDFVRATEQHKPQLNRRGIFFAHGNKCERLLKSLRTNTRFIKNLEPFWSKLSAKVVGIVDYVDPIQAAIRTWDLKFAVMPCQLKWSNNLMMVLGEGVTSAMPPQQQQQQEEDGKCLKFTAATEGELFVVIATTPSDQNTWYIFQITTKGVIFYKVNFKLDFYAKFPFLKYRKIPYKVAEIVFLKIFSR